jgi:hypothetical protein
MRKRHPRHLNISDGAIARLEQESEKSEKTINEIIEALVMEHLPPVSYSLDIKSSVLGSQSSFKKGG